MNGIFSLSLLTILMGLIGNRDIMLGIYTNRMYTPTVWYLSLIERKDVASCNFDGERDDKPSD